MILFLFLQLLPIREVRKIDSEGNPLYSGKTVEVTGIITVGYEFGSKGPLFMEDTSAGIALYGSSLQGKDIKIGDSVMAKGVVEAYKGLIEIQDPEVTVISRGHEVKPETVTISEMGKIEEDVEINEGRFVIMNNVKIEGSGTFESKEYIIQDATGSGYLWIYWTQEDIIGKPIPQGNISIKGVIGQYDSDSPYLDHYQLIPRMWEDLDTTGGGIPEEVIPIGRLYEDSSYLGKTVKVTGVITVATGVFSKDWLDVYVQDTSGGINLFSFDLLYTLEEGDSIIAKGVVGEYNGKLEIKDPEIEIVGKGSPLPEPLSLTSKELNQERYEGMLIKIEGVRVEEEVLEGGRTYEFTDSYGKGRIWIDPDTDIPGISLPSDTFSIIGIKSQYDTLPPYTEGYQIVPRKRKDFLFVSVEPEIISIGEIQSPGEDGYSSKYKGKSVKVKGYITAPKYVFSADYVKMFIQDSTGGVCLYKIISVEGDSTYLDSLFYEIECRGVVDEYKGVTEITNCAVKITGNKKEIVPETLGFNLSLNEKLESKLLTIYGVNPVAEPDVDVQGYNLFFKNGTPVITVRVDSTTKIKLDSIPKENPFIITGIVSQYDTESPYNTGYQLLLRFEEDMKMIEKEPSKDVRIEKIAPNPFAPDLGERLEISINAPYEYKESLYIYNLRGEKIRVLLENSGGGSHTLFWDGKDERERKVNIGIYIILFRAVSPSGKKIDIKKPVVVGTPLK